MKYLKRVSFFIAVLTVLVAGFVCFASQNVEASGLKVKDGQRLCGTFTFKVTNAPDVDKQDFQVCAIVDKKKNFKSTLLLRTDNWNNSIAYVDANGNILNIYDSPTNGGATVGGRPGTILQGGHKQFIPKVGENFETYLQGIKTYLKGLKDRKYWRKAGNVDAVSYKATFKNQIDWSKEDVTADDTNTVANRKAQCEAGGGTWSGDDASGYTCSNNDSLNIAPSASGATSSSDNNACYSNAGAVGWILCPVIEMATNAANGLYQIIEDSFLKIDVTDLFSEDNGVQKAWSAFRDIANIVFIILFIIVILSQLTGFGIDNYGIKKILPKLVVVAVLINLSYIICQLAVDVSNIIGVSLREFLTGLVEQKPLGGTNPNGAQWTVTLAGGALAIGGVTAATLLGGLGAIFAIFGAIIATVVAVFFLWVILIIREGGIVLLIALAPVAIACYLLPNTEKIGKRWLDIFKALLLLYPLCSLVVGAGALASHILSYSNNEVMVLAAMIVQVVPFFFIPMLLRKSLEGMGNIGARLNNIGRTQGRNLSGRAQNALNNTNFAQNRRYNAIRRRTQLANDVLPGSVRTRARRQSTLNAMDEQHKKDMLTLWRDSNGNFDLNAVKEAALNDNTDAITRQAALEAWSDAKPDQIAEAVRNNQLNSDALAYIRSNGKLAAAVGTQDGRVKEFLKTSGNDYKAWANTGTFDASGQATTNEVMAVQNMSASALAAQDHSVLADQVHRDDGNGNYTNMLSDAQMQSFADSPNLVSSLQRDVRENLDPQLPESTQTKAQQEAKTQAQQATEATNRLRQEMATGVSTYEVTHPNGTTIQVRGRKTSDGTILTETGQKFDPLHHNIRHKG